jgi:hypothetical protein
MSTVAAPAAAEAGYPVRFAGELDEPLSRWKWLVKWFLAIPHWLILVVLWIVFGLITIGAFFTILFTRRYPRGMFDFNVGVLRWTWRVQYYAMTGLGTDRYPPFSLAADPNYPARLDVEYPKELNRWLPLVKWLLAIPHLIIVSIITGAWLGWTSGNGDWQVSAPGLVGILSLVAVVILAFRGTYPRDVHSLIVGFSRWVARVVAYVALMRDEYPPFRLDSEEVDEPPAATT